MTPSFQEVAFSIGIDKLLWTCIAHKNSVLLILEEEQTCDDLFPIHQLNVKDSEDLGGGKERRRLGP